MIMRQERKIGEVFEYNGEKIIVKKDGDIMYGWNAVIFVAFLIRDKINKMCTLKKWRIDYENKPYFISCDIHHIGIIHRSLPTDILTV